MHLSLSPLSLDKAYTRSLLLIRPRYHDSFLRLRDNQPSDVLYAGNTGNGLPYLALRTLTPLARSTCPDSKLFRFPSPFLQQQRRRDLVRGQAESPYAACPPMRRREEILATSRSCAPSTLSSHTLTYMRVQVHVCVRARVCVCVCVTRVALRYVYPLTLTHTVLTLPIAKTIVITISSVFRPLRA